MANRSDTFNRSDSASELGTPSDGGSAWIAASGTWGIATNLGYNVSGGGQEAAYLESGAADAEVQVTLMTTGNSEGLVARLTDNNNYLLFIFQVSSGELLLFRREAGSFTQIGATVSSAINPGDVFKMSVQGTAVKCYQNDVLKIDQTSSFNQLATKHGIRSHSSSGGRFDDFSVTDLGGGGLAIPIAAYHYNHHLGSMA